MFKDGQTNVEDEELGGQPIVMGNLIKNVDQIFVKDSASQFQNFYMIFHEFHTLFSTR
jgi:hypothetical protein